MASTPFIGPWRVPWALPKSALATEDRHGVEWSWAASSQRWTDADFRLLADGTLETMGEKPKAVLAQTSAPRAVR